MKDKTTQKTKRKSAKDGSLAISEQMEIWMEHLTLHVGKVNKSTGQAPAWHMEEGRKERKGEEKEGRDCPGREESMQKTRE